jgi:hypothetical protein
MICPGAPALVYNRGRRRDDGSGFTILRQADGGYEGRETGPRTGEKPAGSILVHLADALGVSVILREDFQRRRGSHPRRRFRCRGCAVAMIPLH